MPLDKAIGDTVPELDAANVGYQPGTPGDWPVEPHVVEDGLDKLVAAGGAGAHALLDGATHSDSVADAVTRGSLIIGNSTPKWDELVIGAANKYLRTDGTDPSWQGLNIVDDASPQLGAPLDCQDQNVSFTEQSIAAAAPTTTIDWGKSNKAYLLLDIATITTLAFTNPTGACDMYLLIKQDGTGGRVITNWDADILWIGGAPTITVAIGAVDAFTFHWSPALAKYIGMYAQDAS